MIWGLNFNGTRFPVHPFANRLTSTFRCARENASATWILQGICNTLEELDRMKIQANNGHRKFYTVDRRDSHDMIGLYIGFK